jgi:hypothetical protein
MLILHFYASSSTRYKRLRTNHSHLSVESHAIPVLQLPFPLSPLRALESKEMQTLLSGIPGASGTG